VAITERATVDLKTERLRRAMSAREQFVLTCRRNARGVRQSAPRP